MADPYKDMTPEQRVAYLGGLGLHWISGEGEHAIWQTPSGERMEERAALQYALGDDDTAGGGFAPPKQTQQSAPGAPDQQYDAEGNAWAWDGTQWVREPQFDNPTKAAGYVTPRATAAPAPRYPQTTIRDNGDVVVVDPYTGQATVTGNIGSGETPDQLADAAARRELTAAQTAAQQQQIAASRAQIADSAAQLLIAQQNAQFLRDKEAFAQATSNVTLQREAQQQLFTQQQAVAGLQLQMQQMVAQHQALELNAQQAQAQYEGQRQDRLQSLAGQAGQLAQDPGNRARLAAFALANSGWGQQDAALAQGENFIDTESLTPLESTLRTRQDVMNAPNPITMPAPLDFSNVSIPQVNTTLPAAVPPTVPQIAAAPPAPAVNSGGGLAAFFANGGKDAQPGFGGVTIPQAEDGGFLSGAYISGEEGPEINIPLGSGQTLVLNEKQARAAGIDLTQIISRKAKGGIAMYADGGIFGNVGLGNVQDTNRDLSRSFLDRTNQLALQGTPWATSPLPTPVFASSPGFNPIAAQVLAGLNSSVRGLPAGYFLSQARLLQPAGVDERTVGRSA